jgi:hypothetical protein
MELDPEDLIILNSSNVGRLHLDYPMDATAGRFKQNIQKQVKHLRESTDQLVGAFFSFEALHKEGDLQIVVDARTIRRRSEPTWLG